MKQKSADTTSPFNSKDTFTVGRLALDFLDTAWRIAVPVALFASVGLYADKQIDIAPWLTLLGMVIGFIMAGLLLKKQLKSVSSGDRSQ